MRGSGSAQPQPRDPAVTLKTVLIAIAAAAALIGAALIVVPSAHEDLRLCLDLPRCLGY